MHVDQAAFIKWFSKIGKCDSFSITLWVNLKIPIFLNFQKISKAFENAALIRRRGNEE